MVRGSEALHLATSPGEAATYHCRFPLFALAAVVSLAHRSDAAHQQRNVAQHFHRPGCDRAAGRLGATAAGAMLCWA